MPISFVIGPPAAGKSHFIRENFKDAVIIDLWDFQKDYQGFTEEIVIKTYEEAKNALLKAIRENLGKDIVFEHPLMKAKRRKPYIEAVKKVTSEPLKCFVIKPSLDDYAIYCNRRGGDLMFSILNYDLFEVPDKSEGFDEVFVIE